MKTSKRKKKLRLFFFFGNKAAFKSSISWAVGIPPSFNLPYFMASLSKVPLCYYNLGLTCSNSLKLTCLNVSSRTALNEYGSLTARSAIKKEIEFKILVITKNFPVDCDFGSIQAHDES